MLITLVLMVDFLLRLFVLYYEYTLLLLAVQYVYRHMREYYVLWNVATGSSPRVRQMEANHRLHCYVAYTRILDAVSVHEVYSFVKGQINSDITVYDFHQLLLKYKYAVLYRERIDGSLRGVALCDKSRKEHAGKKYTVITLGVAFFDRRYRGGPLLHYFVCYQTLKEAVFHPCRPLFVACKAFTYKGYLSLVNSFRSVYPKHEQETPEFEKKLIEDLANSLRRPSDKYNAEDFILEMEEFCTSGFSRPVSRADMENKHISFFVDRNPGWRKGHCMFVVAKLNWFDIFRLLVRAIRAMKC